MDLPDTIYYDCNIVNNDQQNPQRLIFNDIRSSPILSNPERYQLNVIYYGNGKQSTDIYSIDPNGTTEYKFDSI